jgi:hypothetical protein
MCYSFKTSIVSFSLGILAVIYGYYTKQPILATLILFYAQIQLSEALIWKGIDDNNVSLNKIGTSYGKYSLPTHNIAIGLGILIYIFFYQKRKLNYKDFIPLIIGVVFYMYVLFFWYDKDSPDTTYPRDRNCKKDCQNNNNRLVWPYPQQWYTLSFLVSIVFCILYVKPLKSIIFINSVFLITFFLSFFVSKNGSSSVWCFSAAILAPLLVLINSYLNH